MTSTGNFSFASGLLSGTATTLTLNGGEIQFSNFGDSTLESDNNNFAGDPTVTINTSGKMTLGRRFIYNAGVTPTNASITNWGTGSHAGKQEGDFAYQGGSPITVKAGDVIMVRE